MDNYQVAKEKLNTGGIYCQWVPLYQLDDGDINSILRTFDEVWDNGTVWVTGKDFVLCGARDSYHTEFSSFKAKAEQAPYDEILRLLGFWNAEEVLSSYIGTLASVRGEFKDAVVNTVERPYLEFSAPRAIFDNTDARNLARILQNVRPDPPSYLRGAPPQFFEALSDQRQCTELVWAGFVADRSGDLAKATQLARRAFDLCPSLGYVRHFAAHTIDAYAGTLRQSDPLQALKLFRRAQQLDPYTPEISNAVSDLEARVSAQ